MALPTSRSTTYAPGSQIKSDDLNDLQDGIVNHEHGEIILTLPAQEAQPQTGSPTLAATRWSLAAGTDILIFPVSLHEGDRVTEVKVYVDEQSGVGFYGAVNENDGTTGTGATLDSGTTAGSGTFRTLTLNGGSLPYTIEANHVVYVQVGNGSQAIGQRVYHVSVAYDRP